MSVDITEPSEADSISLQELDLYLAITAYRDELGLAPIRLSSALSTTANRHVLDTRENIWAEGVELPDRADSLHSWSDAYYYTDNSRPEVMWDAPERVGVEYGSAGYEISAAGFPTTDAALEGWQGSAAHDAVLANRGVWADREFLAIGIGVDTSPGEGVYAGRIFHVWFGEVADRDVPEILGSSDADTITGTVFDDVISGGGGDDEIAGEGGDDEVTGGGGADRLSGGAGDDLLHGGADGDRIYGGGGDDRLYGGDGRDRLKAGGGDDRLAGGDGDDHLDGGGGTDVLAGGGGADTFVFASVEDSQRGGRRDVIVDFERKEDRIDLTEIDADVTSAGHDSFAFIGGDAFSERAGELRRVDGLIEGDVDGDGVADFQIELLAYTVIEDVDTDGDGRPDAEREVLLDPWPAAGDFLL